MTTTVEIPVAQLVVDADNPRHTGPGEIEQLAASIATAGIVSPLIVRPLGSGHYGILSGQRRHAAAIHLGLATVPCIVRNDLDDATAVAIALVDDAARTAIPPMDVARAFDKLRQSGLTYAEIGERCGCSIFKVSQHLQILDDDELRTAVDAGELTVSAAYKVLKDARLASRHDDGSDEAAATPPPKPRPRRRRPLLPPHPPTRRGDDLPLPNGYVDVPLPRRVVELLEVAARELNVRRTDPLSLRINPAAELAARILDAHARKIGGAA